MEASDYLNVNVSTIGSHLSRVIYSVCFVERIKKTYFIMFHRGDHLVVSVVLEDR